MPLKQIGIHTEILYTVQLYLKMMIFTAVVLHYRTENINHDYILSRSGRRIQSKVHQRRGMMLQSRKKIKF